MLKEKFNKLEKTLKTSIKGQDHVLDDLLPLLARSELGLHNPKRPKGSFLFIGPTGTGKTEITKIFSETLFGEEHLMRFDMSEFSDVNALGKLIGNSETPLGRIGSWLDEKECGTILFDEIEKADTAVLDLLLQMLDAGRITLSNNQTLSLNRFFIVCTSNIGSAVLKDMPHASYAAKRRTVLEILENTLRPELIGRFSKIMVFDSLSYVVQKEICQKFVEEELLRLKEKGIHITLDESAIRFLIAEGFTAKFGARKMRDTIEERIECLVAERLLNGLDASGHITSDPSQTTLFFGDIKSYRTSSSFCSKDFVSWLHGDESLTVKLS